MASLLTIPFTEHFLESLARGVWALCGERQERLARARIYLPTQRACRALKEVFPEVLYGSASPTLRANKARDAVASSGNAILLPHIVPLGEPEEEELSLTTLPLGADDAEAALTLPPVISPLMRRLQLAELVMQCCPPPVSGAFASILLERDTDREQRPPVGGSDDVISQRSNWSMDQALRLAAALEKLIDEVQREEVSWDALDKLVPEDFAEHWQRTLTYLEVITHRWPEMLRSMGMMEPIERRGKLLHSRAKQWQAYPPEDLIIIAGSTGSVPATRALMQAVMGLPNGMLVLPGLDVTMQASEWQVIDDTHPQAGMKHLLEALNVAREEVQEWKVGFAGASSKHDTCHAQGAVALGSNYDLFSDAINEDRAQAQAGVDTGNSSREVWMREVMRPATTTEAWAELTDLAVKGVQKVAAPGLQEEAEVIAIALREVLETPKKTAALVTPNRALAERVAAVLRRWDVAVDDSAGLPLGHTPAGEFLRLLARMAESGAAPVPLLALLKHPFATGGLSAGVFRHQVRMLERVLLRGLCPYTGLHAMQIRLIELQKMQRPGVDDALVGWFTQLSRRLEPWIEALQGNKPLKFSRLLALHVQVAEALSESVGGLSEHDLAVPSSGISSKLWQGEAGEALGAFFDQLDEASDILGPVEPHHYAAMFDELLQGITHRPVRQTHPRLHILSPMEARLQGFDRVVLGGLNEGSWPQAPSVDPWMNRAMRTAFGLPAPEKRIGQQAHDLCELLACDEVILTRAEKSEGSPATPSRWWLRMEAISKVSGGEIPHSEKEESPYLIWQQGLRRAGSVTPTLPPEPKPPLEARPRRLSVTDIERLMKDPYAIYAKHVLKLKALDPLDAEPEPRDFGAVAHKALERYAQEMTGDGWSAVAEEERLARLLVIGDEEMGRLGDAAVVRRFWRPRFAQVARWFIEEDTLRRQEGREIFVEAEGQSSFVLPAGNVELHGRADRLERLRDGHYVIVDYKTGMPPSIKAVQNLDAPQLPLEALLLREGAFEGMPAGETVTMEYWRIHGADEGGKITPIGTHGEGGTAMKAEELLRGLFHAYDDPSTPYLAAPDPKDRAQQSDYAHLERRKAWG